MADNYLQPVSNHFAFNDSKLEDVDDIDFLNNSRRRSPPTNKGGSTLPRSDSKGSANGTLCQQQLSYEQKKREIEERSLESTQRSLGILYDTEEVGNATAVELAKQREQLERTNKNLDDINATLRYSQRHLNGIKSVFGSLKNYFSGRNEQPQPPSNAANTRRLSNESQYSGRPEVIHENLDSSTAKYDQHPISRIRNDSTSKQLHVQSQQAGRNNPFEDQLEANLNEMSDNLSRLKGLASELGTEIESQNDLLNNMNYKIEDVDIKMSKQNKDMYKLLGKK